MFIPLERSFNFQEQSCPTAQYMQILGHQNQILSPNKFYIFMHDQRPLQYDGLDHVPDSDDYFCDEDKQNIAGISQHLLCKY